MKKGLDVFVSEEIAEDLNKISRMYDQQNQHVVVTVGKTVMNIKRLGGGRATHKYSVTLVKGEWPNNNDLITICDGDDPKYPRHFGGMVYKSDEGKTASVSVYVD